MNLDRADITSVAQDKVNKLSADFLKDVMLDNYYVGA
jgi:hypothetical protein